MIVTRSVKLKKLLELQSVIHKLVEEEKARLTESLENLKNVLAAKNNRD